MSHSAPNCTPLVLTHGGVGARPQDRDGCVVPKQPAEIGEAAARCYEAGAAMVHFHARDRNGANSGDKAIYAETIREIRARSPILVQTTNGIGVRRDPATGQLHWPSDEEGKHGGPPQATDGLEENGGNTVLGGM